MYPADGRKLPDIHAAPEALRGELNTKLGQFPLFRFWGPAADLIARFKREYAAAKARLGQS